MDWSLGPPRRWRWTFGTSIWLVFLYGAVHDLVTSGHGTGLKALGLLGVAVFCLVYALAPPLLGPSLIYAPDVGWHPLRAAVPLLLFAIGTALLPLTGAQGLTFSVFIAVVGIFLWPTRLALAWVAMLLVLAPVIELLAGWTQSGSPLSVDLGIATGSAAVFGVTSVIRRNRALQLAHEELKALAVEQERVRFARDLHDLLGHSLTVITVKSELAGKLVTRDPARAEAEITDVERLSREALADVRATVAGYREVTLASEVASARSTLEAAGMRAELPGAVDDVPGDRRRLFGWVVREGVTNAVRHSGAGTVRVTVTPTSVEVADDGRGCASADGGSAGHGLDGLRERLSAAGGRMDAGPLPGGGFRLRADVPA